MQPVEIGLGAPISGLYLREDVDMKCNFLMTRFVRKTLKDSLATLVARLIVKSQLIEAVKTNRQLTQDRNSPPMSPPSSASSSSRTSIFDGVDAGGLSLRQRSQLRPWMRDTSPPSSASSSPGTSIIDRFDAGGLSLRQRSQLRPWIRDTSPPSSASSSPGTSIIDRFDAGGLSPRPRSQSRPWRRDTGIGRAIV